jgi:hypothetical protein
MSIPTLRKFRVTLKFQERKERLRKSETVYCISQRNWRRAVNSDGLTAGNARLNTPRRGILPTLTQEKGLFHQIRDLQEWGRHGDFRVTRNSNWVRVKAVPTG